MTERWERKHIIDFPNGALLIIVVSSGYSSYRFFLGVPNREGKTSSSSPNCEAEITCELPEPETAVNT